MPTLTSPATYKEGIVIPQIHPSAPPKEVIVVFIHSKEEQNNAPLVLKALKKAKGILPQSFNGVSYQKKMRKFITKDIVRHIEKQAS
jgi:hypothetical protein